MTTKMTATFLTAMALTAVPLAIAPAAQADVCGDVGGRHVAVGGCTNVGGDIADAAVIGAAVDRPWGYGYPPVEGWPPLPLGYLAFPSFPGELPCYLPSGQPYFTPPGAPCF